MHALYLQNKHGYPYIVTSFLLVTKPRVGNTHASKYVKHGYGK